MNNLKSWFGKPVDQSNFLEAIEAMRSAGLGIVVATLGDGKYSAEILHWEMTIKLQREAGIFSFDNPFIDKVEAQSFYKAIELIIPKAIELLDVVDKLLD